MVVLLVFCQGSVRNQGSIFCRFLLFRILAGSTIYFVSLVFYLLNERSRSLLTIAVDEGG